MSHVRQINLIIKGYMSFKENIPGSADTILQFQSALWLKSAQSAQILFLFKIWIPSPPDQDLLCLIIRSSAYLQSAP